MTRFRTLLVLLGLVATTMVVVQAPAHAAQARAWKTVSAGDATTCAVRDNKASNLYCWGANDYGQLGNGGTTERSRPTLVTTGSWRSVAAGGEHTCAITTGDSLYCWGHNDFGQLGRGDQTDRTKPAKVNTTKWASVSASGQNTCAITRTSKLLCWGYNEYGQVGNGQSGENGQSQVRATPVQIGTFTTWSRVSVGQYSACAVTTTGKLYCWGEGNDGQLGTGSLGNRTSPARVGTLADWAGVSQAGSHACAVRDTKRAYCWGLNGRGQLGTGSSTARTTPTVVGGSNPKRWVAVSAESATSCAIRDNAKLSCWGDSHLGSGEPDESLVARQESRGFTDWTAVTTGGDHACALRANRSLYCWGKNFYGQLGVEADTDERLTPTLVS